MTVPPFWIAFLIILLICIALGTREDMIHGPQMPGDELNWTPRYRFIIQCVARLVFLAVFCALLQVASWISEAFR